MAKESNKFPTEARDARPKPPPAPPKPALASYTVESRWLWFVKNRLRIHGAIPPGELNQIKAIFYIGFGEACDMFDVVGDSEASDLECGEFFARIKGEVVEFHLKHEPHVGGRQ